jgi:hypothetical protein
VEWCERRVDESFNLFHNNDLNTFGAKVMFYSDVAWFFSAFFRCTDRLKMYDGVALRRRSYAPFDNVSI